MAGKELSQAHAFAFDLEAAGHTEEAINEYGGLIQKAHSQFFSHLPQAIARCLLQQGDNQGAFAYAIMGVEWATVINDTEQMESISLLLNQVTSTLPNSNTLLEYVNNGLEDIGEDKSYHQNSLAHFLHRCSLTEAGRKDFSTAHILNQAAGTILAVCEKDPNHSDGYFNCILTEAKILYFEGKKTEALKLAKSCRSLGPRGIFDWSIKDMLSFINAVQNEVDTEKKTRKARDKKKKEPTQPKVDETLALPSAE